MNSLILKRVAICFAVLVIVVTADLNAAAQREAGKAPRILVDASKCGGLWWFPQGGSFNPQQYHQGKALADSMRLKGWQVEELPRGEVITLEKLREADIVIRPPAYFPYSFEEVSAYQQSVMTGTRLLLVGGGAENDVVAQFFGVRFEPHTRFASVRKWIPHPLTQNINNANVAWTPIVEAPPAAVVLAWLSRLEETNPRPVLGYLPYGKGYVVFMSQALIAPGPASAFPSSLISSMVRYTAEEMRRLPLGVPVFATESRGLPPNLLEPLAGATLPQPETAEWRFDWDDVAGAKSYEIVVLGPAAMFPLFHASTTESEYAAPVKPGYIAHFNLEGWSWRVRAHYSDAASGPWSAARRFNVTSRTQR
jgi:hypothetical protein